MIKLTTSILFLLIFISSCAENKSPSIAADTKLQLANTYFNNGLFQASVDEYLEYIDNYNLDDNRAANTYYNIANIYFERINDYEKALQYYFKVKYLYPESTLQNDVGKKIVSCLERLKRTKDANRYVQESSALDKSTIQEQKPGEIIASIGDRKITQGDIDFEIAQLPDYMKQQFSDKNAKKDFLKQYVVQELLYETAKKQGLENDKDVIEGIYRLTKNLITDKIIQNELKDKVQLSASDVQLYYNANKEKYAEKDDKGKVVKQKSFNEVAEQVGRDYSRQKQQEAYQQLAERLIKANNVTFFEDKVR